VLISRNPRGRTGDVDGLSPGRRAGADSDADRARGRARGPQTEPLLRGGVRGPGHRHHDASGFVQGMIEYLKAHAWTRRSCILEDPRNSDDDEPRHLEGNRIPRGGTATVSASHAHDDYLRREDRSAPSRVRRADVSRLAGLARHDPVQRAEAQDPPLNITTLCSRTHGHGQCARPPLLRAGVAGVPAGGARRSPSPSRVGRRIPARAMAGGAGPPARGSGAGRAVAGQTWWKA